MSKDCPYAIWLDQLEEKLNDPQKSRNCNVAAVWSKVTEMRQVVAIWNKFIRARVDKSTLTLKSPIRITAPTEKTFEPDSPVNDFFCWLEEEFGIDVREDFAYKTPWPGSRSCDNCMHGLNSETYVNAICLRCRRQPINAGIRDEKPDMWEYGPR